MNQIKAGAVLNYVIIVLNTLVGLAYTPYMLRCLGQNEYGLYSLVASIIAYLTILDFGFGNAIIRYTAKFRTEGKKQEQWEMFGMFLIVYFIIGIIAIGIGLTLYFNVDMLFSRTMTTDDLRQAQVMMLLLTFNLAFTFPLSIFGAIITAYENFVFQRIINILRIVLSTGVLILVLSMGFKAIALVVVQTIFNLLTLIINYIYCKKKLKIQIIFGKFDIPFIKEICLYSFWIFINAIIDKVYWGTGQFVLGAICGTAAVAIFSIGILFQQMYMSFSYAFSSVLLPKVTSMVTLQKSNSEISNIFIKTGRLQSFVLQFILSGFIIFGSKFITLWAGNEYYDSYIIALMFMLSLYIPAIQSTGILILQARNNLKFRTLVYLGISILAVVLEIFLSRNYGALGCATGIITVLLIGQGVIINIYYKIKQNIDIISFWKSIIIMWIPTICLTVISWYATRFLSIKSMLDLFVWIMTYSIIYIPLSFKLSLNTDERNMITLPLTRLYRKLLPYGFKNKGNHESH